MVADVPANTFGLVVLSNTASFEVDKFANAMLEDLLETEVARNPSNFLSRFFQLDRSIRNARQYHPADRKADGTNAQQHSTRREHFGEGETAPDRAFQASMLHLAGLKSLSVRMKLGMNTSGIMPPPNIAISMLAPQAAPDTASSDLPTTLIIIMIPAKQKAMHTAAKASKHGLSGRIPSQVPSVTMMAITVTTARKQAVALPEST